MNISRRIYLFYCWLKFLSTLQFFCCDKQWCCEYFCLYILGLWLILDLRNSLKYVKLDQYIKFRKHFYNSNVGHILLFYVCASSWHIVVPSPSCVCLFATPWTAVCQASLSFTISQSLSRFMSIASVMTSSHLIL